MLLRLTFGVTMAAAAAFLVADLLLYGAEAVEQLAQPNRTPLLLDLADGAQDITGSVERLVRPAINTVTGWL